MQKYANHRERLVSRMAQSANLQRESVEAVLHKIDWYDLFENANQQFGLTTGVGTTATDGLVKTIIACTDVLRRTGRLSHDPLGGNPYLILNSSILEQLVKKVPATLGQQ